MKILVICFIILQIVVVIHAYLNVLQNRRIEELNQRVLCLEQGRIYVGFTFCADREH